mgnify:CR=1 FL=1
MLIIHTYKFIFIKTKKTAGTSIEIELSKIMSEDDIVTPIKPSHPDHKPRNYIYKGHKLFNHITLSDLKKIFPKEIINNYFKFCVEREPVDKCISDFSMYKNSEYHNKDNITWDSYIRNGNFPIDTNKYTDEKNQLCVDKIFKFEKLNEELIKTTKLLGINFNGLNIRAKSGFRENIKITEKEKEIIYRAFSLSNKLTGYKIY